MRVPIFAITIAVGLTPEMLPVHILIQNLLNDFAQIGMPFDNVDSEYIQKPKTWNTEGIKKFRTNNYCNYLSVNV